MTLGKKFSKFEKAMSRWSLKEPLCQIQGPMSNGALASSKFKSEKKKGNNSLKNHFFQHF